MSIFYRIVVVLLAVAAIYSLYGIVHFKWISHKVQFPSAEFLVAGDKQSQTTFVEFTYYECEYCKKVSALSEEALKVRKDLRYVVRPIVFGGENETGDKLVKIAIAAGLQDKFWDMHKAFIEYPEAEIPDDFIEETALLYGLDYDKLIKDSEGKRVQEIADSNLSAMEFSGVPSVPSFYINNKTYVVSEDEPNLKDLLTVISTALEL